MLGRIRLSAGDISSSEALVSGLWEVELILKAWIRGRLECWVRGAWYKAPINSMLLRTCRPCYHFRGEWHWHALPRLCGTCCVSTEPAPALCGAVLPSRGSCQLSVHLGARAWPWVGSEGPPMPDRQVPASQAITVDIFYQTFNLYISLCPVPSMVPTSNKCCMRK